MWCCTFIPKTIPPAALRRPVSSEMPTQPWKNWASGSSASAKTVHSHTGSLRKNTGWILSSGQIWITSYWQRSVPGVKRRNLVRRTWVLSALHSLLAQKEKSLKLGKPSNQLVTQQQCWRFYNQLSNPSTWLSMPQQFLPMFDNLPVRDPYIFPDQTRWEFEH